MGVPYNETQVIQVALNLLGYPLIQSTISGQPTAEILRNLYDPLMAADLSSPNWRFATKVQMLSQIAALNPGFMWYNSAYQIPADCLAIWQIYPNIPYEVFGEQIWTNGNNQLQMQYRAVVPPSMLPPAYILYFCYLLAVTAAPGITDDPQIITQLNSDMTKWRSQAMIVNTQGRPNTGLTNSTWVGPARSSGTTYGTNWGP